MTASVSELSKHPRFKQVRSVASTMPDNFRLKDDLSDCACGTCESATPAISASEPVVFARDERCSDADLMFLAIERAHVGAACDLVDLIESLVFAEIGLPPTLLRIVEYRREFSELSFQRLCWEVTSNDPTKWSIVPSRYAALALEFRARLVLVNHFLSAELQG